MQERESMFLSLGGSRWRAAQVQQPGNAQLHGSSSPGSLPQELSSVREDPLQALASGKYASSQASPLVSPSCNYTSPEQPVAGSLSGSPKSILSYYKPNVSSLSRELSSDSGVSLPGGEEAMSRDCTLFEPTRRSQALDLAKKLRSSLGSKFADSLRETIKEVVMKHDTNACSLLAQPSLEETTTSGEPASHSQAWKSNGIGNHSSSLALEGLPTLESSLKERSSFTPEHSKRLSWFSQENLSQSAIAELSWGRRVQGVPVSTPSSAMDSSEFFTAGDHSDLSLSAILQDSGAKESWTDGATMPRSRSAVSRRHVFPEATAMGTCRLDSLHLQQTNPNFRARGETGSKPSLYKKANGVDDPSQDMSKGLGKDYESLLELLNQGQSARPRLHAKQAASKDWHEDASTSYYGVPFLELPELSGMESSKAPVKRSREDAYGGGQLSKKQCLLDAPSDDDGAGVKADPNVAGVFEEYLANLTATARVPSFELPDSPLTNLLEDFSRDSIVPIQLP